jgi:hypothetical protein
MALEIRTSGNAVAAPTGRAAALDSVLLASSQRQLNQSGSTASLLLRQGNNPVWPLNDQQGPLTFVAVKSQKYGVTVWVPFQFFGHTGDSYFIAQANGSKITLKAPNSTFNHKVEADKIAALIDSGKFNINGLYEAAQASHGKGRQVSPTKTRAGEDWLTYLRRQPQSVQNDLRISLTEQTIRGRDPAAAVFSGSGSIVARIDALGPAYQLGLIDGMEQGAGDVLRLLSLGASGSRNANFLTGAREATLAQAKHLGIDVDLTSDSDLERARANRMPVPGDENAATRALYERGKMDAKAAGLELLGGGVELRARLGAQPAGAYQGIKRVEVSGRGYWIAVDNEGKMIPLAQLEKNPRDLQRYRSAVAAEVRDVDRISNSNVEALNNQLRGNNGRGNGGSGGSGGSPVRGGRPPTSPSGGGVGTTRQVRLGGQVFTVLQEQAAPSVTHNQGPLVRAMQNGADKNAQATALAWADGAWYVDNLMRNDPVSFKTLTQLGQGETVKLVRPMGGYNLDVYVTGTEAGGRSGGTLAITVVTPWGGKVSMRPTVGSASQPLEISDTVKAAEAVRNPGAPAAQQRNPTVPATVVETPEQLAAREARALQEQQRIRELEQQSEAEHQARLRTIRQNTANELAKIQALGDKIRAENAERDRAHQGRMSGYEAREAEMTRRWELQRQNNEISAAESARVKSVYTPYLAAIQREKAIATQWNSTVAKYDTQVKHMTGLQSKLERDLRAAEDGGPANISDLRAQLEKIKSEYGSAQSPATTTAHGLRNKLNGMSNDIADIAKKMKGMYQADQRSGLPEVLTDRYVVVEGDANLTRGIVNQVDQTLAGGRGWVAGAEERVRALENRVLRVFALDSAKTQGKLGAQVISQLNKDLAATAKAKGSTVQQELARLGQAPDEAALVLGDAIAKARGAANGFTAAQIAALQKGVQTEINKLPAKTSAGASERLAWAGRLMGNDPADYRTWQGLLTQLGLNGTASANPTKPTTPQPDIGDQSWQNIPDNDKAWEHIKKSNPDLADTIERAVRENPGTVTREDILALMRRGATVLEAIAALKSGGAAVGGVPPGNNRRPTTTAASPDEPNNASPQQLYEALGRPKTVKVNANGLEFDLEALEKAGLLPTYQRLRGEMEAADMNRLLNGFARNGAEGVYKEAPNLWLINLGSLVTLIYGLSSDPQWHDLQHLFGKVGATTGGSYGVSVSGEAKGQVTMLRELFPAGAADSRSFYSDIQVTRDKKGRLQVKISEATAKAIEERFEKVYNTREASFASSFYGIGSPTLVAAMGDTLGVQRPLLDVANNTRTDAFIKNLKDHGLLPANPDPKLIAELRSDFKKFDAAYSRLRDRASKDQLEGKFVSPLLKRLGQMATQEFMKAPKAALREQFLRGVGLFTSLTALRGFKTPKETIFNDEWLKPIPQTAGFGEFRDVLDITNQILNRMGRSGR